MDVRITPPLRLDFVWGSECRWTLVLPLVCEIDGQAVIVPEGFETDLASVPKIFQNVLSPAGPWAPAAVLHDHLYRAQLGWSRIEADRALRAGALACGAPPAAAELIYQAVRAGGARTWQAYRKALGLPRSPEPWDDDDEPDPGLSLP